jgi:site-specific DNA-methyltransferase (adenine-specific)
MQDVWLYNDDCLKVMEDLIKNNVKIYAIITDPPYGTIKGMQLNSWDKQTTDWDVKVETIKMFELCEKLLRENGTLILFSQDPYTFELFDSKNRSSNLKYCYRYIYKKNNFANHLLTKKAPVNYFEDILVFRTKYDIYNENPLREYFSKVLNFIGFTRGKINKILGHRKAEHVFYINSSQFKLCSKEVYVELVDVFNISKLEGFLTYAELERINRKYMPVFNLGNSKFKGNILEYSKERDDRGFHPTQKPVALMEDLIKTYTNKNDLILDFTMGSGSTGVAAKNLKRKFIGIEKERKYYEIAKERINNAIINILNVQDMKIENNIKLPGLE